MELYIALFLVSCIPALVVGMYEDQAGLYDWRKQFIGAPRFSKFDQSSHSSRRVVLATDSGVLASINARNGQLGWRQVFAKGDDIVALQHRASILVTLSSGGRLLRGWNVSTGSLTWETVVSEEESDGDTVASAVLVESKSGKSTAIAVLYGDELQLFTSKSGQKLWSVSLSESSLKCQFIHATAGQLHAIGVSTVGMDVTLVTFHATSGDVVTRHTLPAAWVSSEPLDCIVLGSSFLVCLDHVTLSLQTALLEVELSTFVATSLSSLGVDVDKSASKTISLSSLNLEAGMSTIGATLPNALLMQFVLSISPSHQLLLKVDEGSAAISLVRELSDGRTQLYAAMHGDQGHLLMMRHDSQTESLQLEWLDLASGRSVQELAQTVHLPAHHGKPVDACIYLFSKKGSTLGYRIVLATEDHALSLVQQSPRLMWTREESLANVVASQLVELPISTSKAFFETLHQEFGSSAGNVISAFVQRVTSQIVQVKHWLTSLHSRKHAPTEAKDSASTDSEDGLQREDFLRDQFNLHRMIVVATAVGKVFGIDSRNGSIQWTLFPQGIKPFLPSAPGSLPMYQLALLRSVQHFPLEPLAVLLADSQVSECSTAAMLFFNPVTGKILPNDCNGVAESCRTMSTGWSCAPFKPVSNLIVPALDDTGCRVFSVLDSTRSLHTIPCDKQSAHRAIAALKPSLFMYIGDTVTNRVQGYRIVAGSEAESLQAEPHWQVSIPSGEVIISVTGKQPTEVVNSLGAVMPNGSVHYKYLNPNLVAVVTESHDASKPSISLYLIDGVTGSVLYHVQHRALHGPVHLVHSDNWVVYTAYHSKLRRTEVNVVELYDGMTQPSTEPFSSLKSPTTPTALSQSYIMRGTVLSLAVSYTRRGVTHRDVLFGLENGGILSLVKFFLNPHRSLEVTANHPEGTMPYLPELPYNPLAMINYNRTVSAIRHIHTAPSGLESTSLVFAHGLDLFFTRLTPSKTFDVLPADFDRLFIIAILLLLGTATFVTSRLSARRALKFAWR